MLGNAENVMPAIDKPKYPSELTKAYWDKKKSLSGKAQVKKTGVGEALAAAKTAFDKIDWAKIDLFENPLSNMNRYSTDEFEKAYKMAVAEVEGAAVKASKALDDVARACDAAEKRFNEKKLKDDAKLAKEIAERASKLAEATSRMTLLPAVKEMREGTLQRVQMTLDANKKGVKAALTKGLGMVRDLSKEPDAATFNKRQGEVRNVTQIVGTFLRFEKAGVRTGVDPKKMETLWKDLGPFGDSQVQLDPNELPDKVLLQVQKIGRGLKEFAELMK